MAEVFKNQRPADFVFNTVMKQKVIISEMFFLRHLELSADIKTGITHIRLKKKKNQNFALCMIILLDTKRTIFRLVSAKKKNVYFTIETNTFKSKRYFTFYFYFIEFAF